MICIADINIRSYDKRYKKVLTRNSWCTRGSAGWRSSLTSQPRERWCWSKAQRVNKPETNLLERQSQRDLGADALLRLTLGYHLNHVWKKPKLFKWPNQTRFRFTGLFILMKELLPKNLDTLLFSRRTICELKDKNTFPKVREGDTPQGKARVSKLLSWDLEKPYTSCGPWCSVAQKGEWLCRVQAQGEDIRLLG